MSDFDMVGHRQVAFFLPAFPRISHRDRAFTGAFLSFLSKKPFLLY